VSDHNGQALAYVYFEDEPGRQTAAANLLTKDEARRVSQHRQAAGTAAAAFKDGTGNALTDYFGRDSVIALAYRALHDEVGG
jgi:hypothetical protein